MQMGVQGKIKNSILPSMLLYFVSRISIKKVSLFYFEAYHGQNKGDSMHSVIERAKKVAGEIFLPFQLATMSHKNPRAYHVQEVQTNDIMDWKELSQKKHHTKQHSPLKYLKHQTTQSSIPTWTT